MLFSMSRGLGAALIIALGAGAAWAEDAPLRLSAPVAMQDAGFLTHLLPRFRFKTRISVVAVAPGDGADMAFGADGARVFADADGAATRLAITATDPAAAARADKFRDWLFSAPGRAAIEGFPPGGPPVYTARLAPEVVEVAPVIEGDTFLGADLALRHCGRCHVVDSRNRMGGIGSAPSFAAMRGRDGWIELFRLYWTQNPHPSFTQVLGLTEPFDPSRPAFIAPVTITPEDIEAILAYVATLTPLDLGAPPRPR
jgi:mono/diheme cytochrome c family protein